MKAWQGMTLLCAMTGKYSAKVWAAGRYGGGDEWAQADQSFARRSGLIEHCPPAPQFRYGDHSLGTPMPDPFIEIE